MSAKRSQKVFDGNSRLNVYPWTHPSTGRQRWRFSVYVDGRKKYLTFKTKADALAAATAALQQIPEPLAWETLDQPSKLFLAAVHRHTGPADRDAVLAFLRSRDSSAEIVTAVAAFAQHKATEAGETTPYLTTMGNSLERMAKHFAGRRVSEIHAPDLAEWLAGATTGLSAKSIKDARSYLVGFWRWALFQGLAGSDPITAAERLPNIKLKDNERRVLTAAELCSVLNAVHEDFRAWVVLGAFAGLRPEEIAPGPAKKSAKRGLHCEEIDWQFSVIRLPAVVSKVGIPRIVPMTDALKAGLQWAGIKKGMTGPTTLANPSQTKELARLGKLIFQGAWPKDSLRHSYGSFRNAIVRSLSQVAEEMGTSVNMLNRHYHNPQPEELGTEWFSLRPNCSATVPRKIVWNIENSPDLKQGIIENSTKTA